MLKRMGLKVLDERPYRMSPPDQPPVWLHDFGMQTRLADADVDIDGLHAVFEDAFGRIFRGEVENDDFNRLVVAARMPAAEIVVLRAYAKYLRQIGFPLSQAFIESTLVRERRHRAQSRRAVEGAVRSRTRGRRRRRRRGAPRGDRGGARQRRQPVGGPRAAPVPRADHGDDAHEFLAPRCARAAAHVPLVQVRPVEGSRAARAEADVRDLRLFAALRGRPHARRPRGARRASAGRIGRRISAPRSSASSRRRWSRTW